MVSYKKIILEYVDIVYVLENGVLKLIILVNKNL